MSDRKTIVLEGRLRERGDAMCSRWELDGTDLTCLLPVLPKPQRVPLPDSEPLDADTLATGTDAVQAENGEWYLSCWMYADLGRVRITIEPLEDE